jgi:hypothetical protein
MVRANNGSSSKTVTELNSRIAVHTPPGWRGGTVADTSVCDSVTSTPS